MAYTPYYPNYQPNYYGQNPYMIQPTAQQPMHQQNQQAQQTTQQNGFVRVQNENEARMYPVAPGNSITFIDENAPYCYTKTMDFSQLDRPKFEKYRLVKEEETPTVTGNETVATYATKAEVDAVRGTLSDLEEKVAKLMAKKTIKVKEDSGNE